MSFKWFTVIGVLFLILSASCTSDKKVQCITSLDCENGLVCEDGVCVEGTSQTDTDGLTETDSDSIMPDNSGGLPDNNNTNPDDTVVDNEPVDKDEVEDKDEADMDIVDDVDPDDKEEEDDSEVTDEVDEEVEDEDDFVPTPCDPNPCEEIVMSDGICTIQGVNYKCGCESGYYWIKGECRDINECLDSMLNNCDENADCLNSTGSYSCECHTNYSGDGTECTADTQTVACTNTKPDYSSWNAANADGMISQTWNGTAWDPADDTCLWDCDEHYLKDGDTCDPERITFNCADKPATGTEWNAVSTYERVWNGTEFSPAETVTEYNETPSDTACRYKCAENYEWKDDACVAQKRIFNCPNKPFVGTVWNTVSSYEQTYTEGTGWIPAATATVYEEESSETECRYICAENYTWNGSICEADTQQAVCPEKPANTEWNDSGKNGEYTQTWNGVDAFEPVILTSEYSITAGNCKYICADGFHLEENQCVSNTRENQSCTGLPQNAHWNSVSSISQFWSGSWTPTTVGEYNITESTEKCRFICNDHYTWNSAAGTCDPDTQTVFCSPKPDYAEWNDPDDPGKYTQTWEGTSFLPVLETEHSLDAGDCKFICTDGYTWNGAECEGGTLEDQACTGLPENASWNTASVIDQSWSGSEWVPSTTGTYNLTPSTEYCYFKCDSYYYWNAASCNYCNTDTHCGSSCSQCGGATPKCTATSPHCVECLTDDDCEENYTCNGSNVCEEVYFCGDGIIRYDDHPLDSGILVQLHMDENTGSTTADTSGNGRTTSLNGTAWTTNGKYENALVFNGTTSYAVIGGGYTPPTNNFTMEAWVKVVGTHEIDPESTSGTAGTSGQKELFGANHGEENAGAGISVGTNGISVYEHGAGYMPATAVYSGFIGTGWNHIAVTYTNKKPRIYLNGILVRTGLTSPRGTVSAPTMIGKGSYGAFNGTVDEVRIYNTALSAAQIRSHFYCDDYNNDDGDGCDSTCHVEEFYTCSGEPSDCTDNVALCTQKIAEFNYDFSSAQGWPVTDYWYISSGAIKSDSDFNNWTNTIISPSHDLSSCAGQNIRIRVSSFNNLEEGYDKLYIEVPGESCEVPYNGGTFTEYSCVLPESAKVNSFTTTFKVTTDANTLEGSARFDWIIIERY